MASRSSSQLLLRLEIPAMGITRTAQLALDPKNHELVIRKVFAWCGEVKRWDPNHTVIHDQFTELDFNALSQHIARASPPCFLSSPRSSPRSFSTKSPRSSPSHTPPTSVGSSSRSSRSSSARSSLAQGGQEISNGVRLQSQLPMLIRDGGDSMVEKAKSSKGKLDQPWSGASSWQQALMQTLDGNIASLKPDKIHEAIDADVITCVPEKRVTFDMNQIDAGTSSQRIATEIAHPQPPTSLPTARPRRRHKVEPASCTPEEHEILGADAEGPIELEGMCHSSPK